MQNADRNIVLEVEGVTKRFPGIVANDNVSLTLHRGEILALLGENGAGKSTLMNIIYGLYHADEGTIRVNGEEVRFASPHEAIHKGIGMVHQHFQLIPVMIVAENVVLGEENTVRGETKKPFEETDIAGQIRLIWGILWRVLGLLVGIVVGYLSGLIALLLVFVLASYMVPTDQFDVVSIREEAVTALTILYPDKPSLVTAMVWLPLLLAVIVGATLTVLGYSYARRTWRGRALQTTHLSRVDTFIDTLLEFFTTLGSVFKRQRAANRVSEISKQYGLEVDPDAVVEKLPVGAQQRVEIVKALYRHADILILDEPTAVLTPQESLELFKIMRELASQGVSIIFITHKLKEVFAVADRIEVMRGGKVIGLALPSEATEQTLAEMMVGRKVILRVAKKPATPGEVVLSVRDLYAKDSRGAVAIDGVSFEVCQGEVLGIAGVQGNGQTELVEVLTGLQKPISGEVGIQGAVYTHASSRAITKSGTAHVPEDRQRHGMVKAFAVRDNLILNRYYEALFSTLPSLRELPLLLAVYAIVFGLIMGIETAIWSAGIWPALQSALKLSEVDAIKDKSPYLIAFFATLVAGIAGIALAHVLTSLILKRLMVYLKTRMESSQGGLMMDGNAIDNNARALVKEYDIRTPSILTNAGNLSGGNQQKMIVAREFSRKPRLLIASQPTRGIDVGSIEFIHQRIVDQRDEGAAVLLVSAELDEIMALSDRIAVMYRGHVIDTVDANTATREQLGLLMAGIKAGAMPEGIPA